MVRSCNNNWGKANRWGTSGGDRPRRQDQACGAAFHAKNRHHPKPQQQQRCHQRETLQTSQHLGAADDEGRAPQPADGDAIGTMAEPDAGETHQLLTTHSNSRQHRRDLNVLNQQTIQKAQDQDAEDPQAELEQTQLQRKTQGSAVHQARLKS